METSVSSPSFPRMNEPAPAFEAPTTADSKKLSDYIHMFFEPTSIQTTFDYIPMFLTRRPFKKYSYTKMLC